MALSARGATGNDHGFGAHCYSWEFASQAPWCYVGDDCKSAEIKGSFGRKFEECTSSYEFVQATALLFCAKITAACYW